eukprot:CAMPEP_0185821790 /NCGR_PEP_ID=MMETSP1322-20130828/25732_1 /TAXON_ID=265543 /ORGANISM="Minutocellus polymorphus, Strain RCC2270" /LENGTH=33 /DNA_ID= /DNA_START= /DNA_END= /DNA_ORIENTATION=
MSQPVLNFAKTEKTAPKPSTFAADHLSGQAKQT